MAIGDALDQLETVVKTRLAAGDAEASYVASLAAKGRGKIAQKLGEEAVETVIAALTEVASMPHAAGPMPVPFSDRAVICESFRTAKKGWHSAANLSASLTSPSL